MRARYAIACLLAGIGVCAAYGSVAGLVGALTSPTGDLSLGVAFGAFLAGLLRGTAFGAFLGGVSGLLATVVARGTTDQGTAAVRVGGTVLVTYLVLLLLLTGLAGSVLGGDLGWALPGGLRWVGVVVPSVLAAVVSGRAARSVADMEPEPRAT